MCDVDSKNSMQYAEVTTEGQIRFSGGRCLNVAHDHGVIWRPCDEAIAEVGASLPDRAHPVVPLSQHAT